MIVIANIAVTSMMATRDPALRTFTVASVVVVVMIGTAKIKIVITKGLELVSASHKSS